MAFYCSKYVGIPEVPQCTALPHRAKGSARCHSIEISHLCTRVGNQVQQFASEWKSYPARVSPAVLFDQEDCRISRVTNKVVVWLWIHICDTRNIWSKKIETTVVYDEYFSFPPHCDVTAEHFVCCRGWKIMFHIDKEALKLNYNASPHLVSILVKKKTHPSGILDSIKQWTFTLRFIPEFR